MSTGDTDHEWDGNERRRPNGNGERSAFERHAQTVLATIIALGIGWLISNVVDLGKEQAKTSGIVTTRLDQLQENNKNIQDQILRVSQDRVTIGDMRRLEERLDRIERQERERNNERPRR